MGRSFLLVAASAMLTISAGGASAPVAPDTAPASAQPGVTIRIDDVATGKGVVMVALCNRASFMKRTCPLRGHVPAKRGSVTTRFDNVPSGTWAVEVFHDENGNGQLDRNGLGIPVEGVGFSRDAKGQYGPPTFEAAAVSVKGPTTIPVTLTY